MKKILFVLPSLTMGGLERMQVTLANSLCRAGYDVTVMILQDNRALADELDEQIRLIVKEDKQHLGKSIPYIRHKLYDDGMWEKRASPATLYNYFVGKEKYDVEIAFYHGLTTKIISGSLNKNAVHIAWVHNDFSKITNYRFNFRNVEEVRKAYRTFDHVVCVSEAARQGYLDVIGDTGNTCTIYNMLPVKAIQRRAKEKISYRYPETGLNLVLVGRLRDDHKGQRRLISVVSHLRRDGRNISLTLVGDGRDREAIERHIHKHHAEDYIFLVGSQKNPFPYIAGADMLVCASYYEGFNLTVAEALILGVPVLSTECTGPCEILDRGKYGMLTDNSREGLYRALRFLADDPSLVEFFRRKAQERMDFFCEETIMKQITDLFEEPAVSEP